MSIFTHLVPATIEQARASQRVTGEEDARLYAQLDHLLAALRSARGEEKPEILRRLRACEGELVEHLERSGRHVLAGAMLHRQLEGEPDED